MIGMAAHKRNQRHAGTGTYPWARVTLAAAVPVGIVAVIAGIVSYSHIVALGLRTAQSPVDAHLLPFAVDGLIVAGSVILLAGSWLGWLGVIPGIVATVFANVESGLPHGALAAALASWPALAFSLAAFILERWLADRRAAAEADVAERDTLRTDLTAEQAARLESEAELAAAREKLEQMTERAESLARKLTTAPRNRTASRKRKPAAAGTAAKADPDAGTSTLPSPEPEPAEAVGIDAEARILQLVAEGHSASEAGVLAGRSDSYGRQVVRKARELAAVAPKGQDGSEEGSAG